MKSDWRRAGTFLGKGNTQDFYHIGSYWVFQKNLFRFSGYGKMKFLANLIHRHIHLSKSSSLYTFKKMHINDVIAS